MINNFFLSYNASIRVYRAQNITNKIWPKHPTLHLQLAKTSWPKHPWPKCPTFAQSTQADIRKYLFADRFGHVFQEHRIFSVPFGTYMQLINMK